MVTDKINHICFENKLLKITVIIFSLILFLSFLVIYFLSVLVSFITVSTGSSVVIDNYCILALNQWSESVV